MFGQIQPLRWNRAWSSGVVLSHRPVRVSLWLVVLLLCWSPGPLNTSVNSTLVLQARAQQSTRLSQGQEPPNSPNLCSGHVLWVRAGLGALPHKFSPKRTASGPGSKMFSHPEYVWKSTSGSLASHSVHLRPRDMSEAHHLHAGNTVREPRNTSSEHKDRLCAEF